MKADDVCVKPVAWPLHYHPVFVDVVSVERVFSTLISVSFSGFLATLKFDPIVFVCLFVMGYIMYLEFIVISNN
jgi:hypothetical protein